MFSCFAGFFGIVGGTLAFRDCIRGGGNAVLGRGVRWRVEAAGSPGVLRVVSFAKGETDEGLDVAQPIVVEGELVVIRHPAREEFPAVVELQVRDARRVGLP